MVNSRQSPPVVLLKVCRGFQEEIELSKRPSKDLERWLQLPGHSGRGRRGIIGETLEVSSDEYKPNHLIIAPVR